MVYLGWTNWFLRILRWITVRKIHSRKESVYPFKSRDGFSHEGCMQNARFKLQKWNPHVISWFWDSNSWSNRPCLLFLHLYSGITGHHPKMGIFLVPTDPQNGSFWPGLSERVPSTQCLSQNSSCEIFYLEGIPVYPIFRHAHVQHQVAYMILYIPWNIPLIPIRSPWNPPKNSPWEEIEERDSALWRRAMAEARFFSVTVQGHPINPMIYHGLHHVSWLIM